MQKLSEKRVKGLEFSSFTRGVSIFRENLEKVLEGLEVGEAIKIDATEYKMKTSISNLVANINVKIEKSQGKQEFKTRTLMNKVGWVIIRVK